MGEWYVIRKRSLFIICKETPSAIWESRSEVIPRWESVTDHIMKKCVKEDAAYMADYIADETGKVKEIRYDLISEPVMDPVSDTIPLDPLEY